MALSPQNPLISGYNVPKTPLPQVSPQEWEYVQQLKRTGYDPSQLQQVQQQMQQIVSDPYVEFENEFSRCSPTIQNKILNDSEFIDCFRISCLCQYDCVWYDWNSDYGNRLLF